MTATESIIPAIANAIRISSRVNPA